MLSDKILVLFLMRGMSLEKWKEVGIYDREIETYKRLSRRFKKIYIVSYGNKEEKKFEKKLPENIEILPKGRHINSYVYSFLSPLLHYSKIVKADYIKTEQMDGAWSGVITKLISKGKFILRTGYIWSRFHAQKTKKTFFDPIVQLGIELIERICCFFADYVVVVSLEDKKYLIEKHAFIKNKIYLIPNYINTDIFKNSNVNKDKDIIFVGRLSPQKNITYLLEALSGLPYKLTIIGQGDLETEIKSAAEKLQVKVNFIKNVNNYGLADILNRHKIFVLPSFFEGMPKALLEAMSCGLCCLVSNAPGNREVIKSEKNGILFPINQSDYLRKTIVRLMEDEKIREELGRNAQECIIKNYSLAKNISLEIQIYESAK